jgi:Zn finger protein HypA/HybF involved in hydrogenase expression
MKIVDLKKEEIEKMLSEATSIRQVLLKIGVNSNGSGAYNTFRSHCKNLGVEMPKFKNNGGDFSINKIPLEDVLVENSTYQNRSSLKRRLLKNGLLEYKCYGDDCGISEWKGNKLSLHLEHKNGVNNDHRIENLELLCPNCHSQTKTYAGKQLKSDKPKIKKEYKKKDPKEYKAKNRKIERPPYDKLKKEVGKMGYSAVGRKYGVSDNSIRKWLRFYEKYGF